MKAYINGSTSDNVENLLIDALWFGDETADAGELSVEENNMCLCGVDAEGYCYTNDIGKNCYSMRWKTIYMFYGENGRLNKIDNPSPQFIKEFLERRNMKLINAELTSESIGFRLNFDDIIFAGGEDEEDFIFDTSKIEAFDMTW